MDRPRTSTTASSAPHLKTSSRRAATTLARLIRLCTLTWVTGATTAVAQDITSNLVGHWRLTESSGTTANDSAGAPHHGAYAGSPALATTVVPGHGVAAVAFDGVNDSVAVPSEATFDLNGPMTVSVWIKVNTFTKQWQAIFGKGDSSWRLLRNDLSNTVQFHCPGLSAPSCPSAVVVTDGKWRHIVGVYTGSVLQIYVDGQLNNSVAATGAVALNNYPVQIGANAEVAGREFLGSMYDARVYSRALSAADIAYLYTLGGPVGYWKFNEAAGTTLADTSVREGHAAFSSGAPAWIPGVRDAALQFDGIDDAADTDASFTPPSVGTVAFWFQRYATPVGRQRLFGNGGDWEAWQDPDGIIRFDLGCDGNTVGLHTNSALLQFGRWYHLAAVFNRTTGAYQVYIDGQLVRSGTTTMNVQPAGVLSFGTRTGSAERFAGALDDFRVYDRTLSLAEITKLYGFVGHWNFNEGAGVTAADATGMANHATLTGGAGWDTDCAGNKALLTTAAGGIARTGAPFEPPSEGAVTFWMKGTGTPPARRRLMGVGGDWEIRQEPNGVLYFDFGASPYVGNEPFSTITAVDANGRWYHVAAIFNDADNSYSVYVDGELKTSGISPVDLRPQSAAALSFGARTGSPEYWPGSLRDFRIYNRRLAAKDVSELAGLALHWKCDEASGATVSDSSGCARHGSVVGTPAWIAGKYNGAIQLNGASYVSTSSAGLTPRNVSIAAWANLTAADTGGAELISLGDFISIRLDDSGNSRAIFYDGAAWQSVAINQTFAGIGWRHFAAVFDDDNNVFRFYINGAEVGSMVTTASIPWTGLGSNIVLGRHGNGGTTFDFTGRIDDARVYTRALCPEQVLELVNDGGGAYQGVRILRWVETR